MFDDPTIAGSWPALAARLDAAQTLARWGSAEPCLGGWDSLSDLPGALRAGADADRADALLGGLVRVAAADGGDDPDAVLVLVGDGPLRAPLAEQAARLRLGDGHAAAGRR